METTTSPLFNPRDVVQCLRLAFERDNEGTDFNVVSFIATMKELFEEIAAEMQLKPPEKHLPYQVAYVAAVFTELFAKKSLLSPGSGLKALGTTRKPREFWVIDQNMM
ncbi:MAG TPA: hypothetical protein EYP23_05955 [Thermoplasmata archaeon]|nr:hypothetical protein [Thermoplasmata archaeon]